MAQQDGSVLKRITSSNLVHVRDRDWRGIIFSSGDLSCACRQRPSIFPRRTRLELYKLARLHLSFADGYAPGSHRNIKFMPALCQDRTIEFQVIRSVFQLLKEGIYEEEDCKTSHFRGWSDLTPFHAFTYGLLLPSAHRAVFRRRLPGPHGRSERPIQKE